MSPFKGTVVNQALPSLHGGSLEFKIFMLSRELCFWF